jgi:hypothetical protein
MLVLVLLLVAPGCGPSYAAAASPSVEQFKQVLEARLQKLKPEGTTVRTVLFQDVIPGKPKGGSYRFLVTAIIHDYGAGFPKKRYYGETCVGRMDKWKFDLIPDDFGGWNVQGRMTVSGRECKKNPSEGVSAIPLAGLSGKPAAKSLPVDAKATAPAPAGGGEPLYLGKYACHGVGGQMMAGMGFHLKPGGKYDDVAGGRGGSYVYDARESTITFRGGFLDGQVGSNVRQTGFNLASTVNCEPFPSGRQ